MRIAIDGPAGAGKSTIAKHLAEKMGITYIDSGAMYRAAALKALQNKVDIQDEEALKDMMDNTDIHFDKESILMDGEDVSRLIRTPEVSKMASVISAVGIVRAKLVDSQRRMGESEDVVMDGRDIGTNVFPDAEYKFYVTADARVRAARRQKELEEKGVRAELPDVLADIVQRDKNDSERTLNPLKKAGNAVEIDTSGKSIGQVVAEVTAHIR